MYFVSRPEQFAPLVQARTADPATGKPDPEKLKAFNEANPETTLQGAYLSKASVPASYGAMNYWSTNACELVIGKVEPMLGGACDKIPFNPLVLPGSIKASADPELNARAAPYAISLGRRLSEAAL